MGKATLVGPDIDGGRELIEALEKAGLPISIAAWLRLKESFDWQLFIASPDVQTHGPTTVNKFVDRIRVAIKSPISMNNVTVTNTTNHFVNGISLYRYPHEGVSQENDLIRFRSGFLGDIDVEDGFIYRIDRNVKPSKVAPRPDAAALKKARTLAA